MTVFCWIAFKTWTPKVKWAGALTRSALQFGLGCFRGSPKTSWNSLWMQLLTASHTIPTYTDGRGRILPATCTYNFPLHIVPTDLRPDLVRWDDIKSHCALLSWPCVMTPTLKRLLSGSRLSMRTWQGRPEAVATAPLSSPFRWVHVEFPTTKAFHS